MMDCEGEWDEAWNLPEGPITGRLLKDKLTMIEARVRALWLNQMDEASLVDFMLRYKQAKFLLQYNALERADLEETYLNEVEGHRQWAENVRYRSTKFSKAALGMAVVFHSNDDVATLTGLLKDSGLYEDEIREAIAANVQK